MTTTDTVADSIPANPMRWFRWTRGLLLHPRSTMQQIAKYKRPAWVLPMVLLAVLSGIAAWESSTIRVGDPQPAIITSSTEPPIHVQVPLAPPANHPSTPWVTIPGAMLRPVLFWSLTALALHLLLTLHGSRVALLSLQNCTAWACMPFSLRWLLRILINMQAGPIEFAPGLAGFIPSIENAWLAGLHGFLGQIDVYLIWFALLLTIGVTNVFALQTRKAVRSVGLSVLLVAILLSIPTMAEYILQMKLAPLVAGAGSPSWH